MKLVFFYKRILKLLNKAQFNVVSYLCLKQREVSKREKYYSEEINSNKKNNISELKNYLL